MCKETSTTMMMTTTTSMRQYAMTVIATKRVRWALVGRHCWVCTEKTHAYVCDRWCTHIAAHVRVVVAARVTDGVTARVCRRIARCLTSADVAVATAARVVVVVIVDCCHNAAAASLVEQ
jgi:hypothetical protein